MKSRGLKQQLALLRDAGVASCEFHPNGQLAAVEFARGGPPVSSAKQGHAPPAARGEDHARARALVAAELDVDTATLAAVLNQIPDLGGVS